MIDIEKKINKYKEEKKSKSVFNQINETFWTDIEIGEKGNKQFDKRAELYLKEKKTIWDTVKISFLELRLSIFDKDFSKFKEELDNLKKWITKNSSSNENIDSKKSEEEQKEQESKELENDSKDIDSNVELSDIQKKIITLAKENTWKSGVRKLINNTKFLHCRWWADAIYKKAWLPSAKREVIYQNWKYYTAIWEQLSNRELINKIRPWDWLYVNNKNSVDKNWDHSVVFLWRKNWVVWQAETASYPWSGDEAVIKTYNLNDNEIRHITRPLVA